MAAEDVLERIEKVTQLLDRLEETSELVEAMECLRVRVQELERRIGVLSKAVDRVAEKLKPLADGVLSISEGRRRNSQVTQLDARITALENITKPK
jgi:archaellum component FlaC